MSCTFSSWVGPEEPSCCTTTGVAWNEPPSPTSPSCPALSSPQQCNRVAPGRDATVVVPERQLAGGDAREVDLRRRALVPDGARVSQLPAVVGSPAVHCAVARQDTREVASRRHGGDGDVHRGEPDVRRIEEKRLILRGDRALTVRVVPPAFDVAVVLGDRARVGASDRGLREQAEGGPRVRLAGPGVALLEPGRAPAHESLGIEHGAAAGADGSSGHLLEGRLDHFHVGGLVLRRRVLAVHSVCALPGQLAPAHEVSRDRRRAGVAGAQGERRRVTQVEDRHGKSRLGYGARILPQLTLRVRAPAANLSARLARQPLHDGARVRPADGDRLGQERGASTVPDDCAVPDRTSPTTATAAPPAIPAAGRDSLRIAQIRDHGAPREHRQQHDGCGGHACQDPTHQLPPNCAPARSAPTKGPSLTTADCAGCVPERDTQKRVTPTAAATTPAVNQAVESRARARAS